MSLAYDDGSHRPKRDRSREGAGKSDRSHIKHDLIRRAVGGQIGAYRLKKTGRVAIIDGNAGDGLGVNRPQLDFFSDNMSMTTADVATQVAAKVGNAVVILCESDKLRRDAIALRFPDAIILRDNAHAPGSIPSDCEYAVWISDPCGPAGHGVDAMQEVARSIRSDFVVAMNEGAIVRIAGTESDLWKTARDRYAPMIESPTWWADELGRRRMSRTPIINGAANFKYRVLVVADYLADSALRRPFEEIKR